MPVDLTLLSALSSHPRGAGRNPQANSSVPAESRPVQGSVQLPDPRRHSPVCCCLLCEQQGTGEQAMRSVRGNYRRFLARVHAPAARPTVSPSTLSVASTGVLSSTDDRLLR